MVYEFSCFGLKHNKSVNHAAIINDDGLFRRNKKEM